MQYRLNLSTHKKEQENKEINTRREITMLIGLLLGGMLISRVIVYLNTDTINGMAPFGIAFFIAIMMTKDKKKIFATFIGTMIGYCTIVNNINEQYSTISMIIVLAAFSLVYGAIINNYSIRVNITLAVINTIIIIPIYYIVKYGAECIREFNENYMFSPEEVVSVGILACLLVCGFGNLSVLGISLREILAFTIILIFSYPGGSIYGATIGVVMGLIIGMCSGDMMYNISFYSMIGLVSGIFKDFGKIFTSITFLLTFSSLSIYSNTLNKVSLIQIGIGIVLFFVIPKKIFDIIEIEINMDKKRVQINQIELNQLKDEFTDRIKGLGSALFTVSNTLTTMSRNSVLNDKVNSEALISSLADRVCSRCSRSKQCWESNLSLTYSAFEELFENCEKNREVFPNQLEKVCLEKDKIIRNSDSLMNKLKSEEMKKESLEEGRLLLSKHVKKIAFSIDNMLGDFKREVVLCGDLERIIRRGFNRNSIKYKSIFCYRDISGRARVKVTLDLAVREKFDEKQILSIINNLMNTPMTICSEQCDYKWDEGECVIVFQETPKFQVVSYGAISQKEREEYMGDTYSFGKTKEGNYMTVISDGMGTGPEASKESGITVEIIERFFEAGFDYDTAVNMVNSLMNMKFDADEKVSTLDLNVIDLYSGEISFVKVGAVPSFIKRGKIVKKISSNMPPFGLVDELDMKPIKANLKSGDIIITISDGILDVTKKEFANSNWIEKYLINAVREPKQLAQDILQKAKEFNGGVSRDDMTVVVSKISNL